MQRLINWLGRSFSTQKASRPNLRPTLEELEPRLAPAVITMYPEFSMTYPRA
jgi:hypothetical protein